MIAGSGQTGSGICKLSGASELAVWEAKNRIGSLKKVISTSQITLMTSIILAAGMRVSRTLY
jgi:hypothetical protein